MTTTRIPYRVSARKSRHQARKVPIPQLLWCLYSALCTSKHESTCFRSACFHSPQITPFIEQKVTLWSATGAIAQPCCVVRSRLNDRLSRQAKPRCKSRPAHVRSSPIWCVTGGWMFKRNSYAYAVRSTEYYVLPTEEYVVHMQYGVRSSLWCNPTTQPTRRIWRCGGPSLREHRVIDQKKT